MISAKFGWNWPTASWDEDENEKSWQTDGRTTCDHVNNQRYVTLLKHVYTLFKILLFKIENQHPDKAILE